MILQNLQEALWMLVEEPMIFMRAFKTQQRTSYYSKFYPKYPTEEFGIIIEEPPYHPIIAIDEYRRRIGKINYKVKIVERRVGCMLKKMESVLYEQ